MSKSQVWMTWVIRVKTRNNRKYYDVALTVDFCWSYYAHIHWQLNDKNEKSVRWDWHSRILRMIWRLHDLKIIEWEWEWRWRAGKKYVKPNERTQEEKRKRNEWIYITFPAREEKQIENSDMTLSVSILLILFLMFQLCDEFDQRLFKSHIQSYSNIRSSRLATNFQFRALNKNTTDHDKYKTYHSAIWNSDRIMNSRSVY